MLYTLVMPYKDVAPFPKQMTIVMGLVVVGLMAFGLALSYYKNVLFDQQLLVMQQRNASLRDNITTGYAELRYLQSSQYKDRYAKENFGLLRPGEKVLFVSEPENRVSQHNERELSDEEKIAVYEENLRSIRVIDHWKIYLFHREQIEELRRGA